MGRGRTSSEEPRSAEEEPKFSLEPLPDLTPKSTPRKEVVDDAQNLRDCLADANLSSISDTLMRMQITNTKKLRGMSTEEISALGLKKLSEKKLRAVIETLHEEERSAAGKKAAEDEKKRETEERLSQMKKARSWLFAAGILKDIETLDEPVESKGNTRIHMAAWTDSIDALQLLIDAGAQLNLQDADGDTPLSNAAHQGNMRAVQLLLKAGADPRIANLSGNTPGDTATAHGHHEIATLLNSFQ
mmetsp:Transcript_81868/g.122958  ORF Transcript_81868/g.122958 Transcript_81868/m.122958 type:complete len:245 (-) Transcript_81868:26-760(-)